MPKDTRKIVDEINDALRTKGGDVITYLWRDFYTLCSMQRWRSEKAEDIGRDARERYGLAVCFAQSVVIVAHDRNFRPV